MKMISKNAITLMVGVISLLLLSSAKSTLRQINYKKRPGMTFLYKEVFPEKHLGIPTMSGEEKIALQVLTWKNLADAVEDRYHLKRGSILSVMVIETGGVLFLHNLLGDGGYGLCHMQPSTAREFGLRIYKNCRSLICDGKNAKSCVVGGRKANHAEDLRSLIISKKYDQRILVRYDDRLQPLLNLDAVGRMLKYHMLRAPKGVDPLGYAIMCYSGPTNYRKGYKAKFDRYMKLLQNREFIRKVQRQFEARNPNFTIDNKRASFKDYLKYFWGLNYNYGLKEYQQMSVLYP